MEYSEEDLIEIVRRVKESRENGKYINDDVFCEIVRTMKK